MEFALFDCSGEICCYTWNPEADEEKETWIGNSSLIKSAFGKHLVYSKLMPCDIYLFSPTA